nr:reverse transcriptase domain-containing protein [Tanacetum cinerariifolium]
MLQGLNVYSKIDLRSRYHQLRVHDEDILKTVFRTRYDYYEFQDILLYSKSKEEHAQHLKLILKLLKKEEMYAKFSKCEFWLSDVQFLGYMIESEGIHVDLAKIESNKDWASPKTSTEIHQFLVPGDIVHALEGRGKRKNAISLKEVVFTKEEKSPFHTFLEITSDSECECDNQEPLPPLPKLSRVNPIGTSANVIPPADLTQTSPASEKTKQVVDKEPSVKIIKKKAQTKPSYVLDTSPVKKSNSSTKQLLLTLIEKLNINQEMIAYSLCWGLDINIGNIMFYDLIVKLTTDKNGKEPNTCYARYLSIIIKHLLWSAYKNEKLKTLKPYLISATSFKTPSASELPLTSHMLKVAKLSPMPQETLILPSQEVNIDNIADKSLSKTVVQPVGQSKAPIDKKSKKKKPSSSKPKTLKIVRESSLMKQVIECENSYFPDFKMAAEGNGDPPVLDLRTMEELCQPSLNGQGGNLPVPDLRIMEELCQPTLNGQGGLIAPITIQATNFRLKNDMIQQVQNSCQFHGLPGDDANKHIDKFLHVTQSINRSSARNLFPPLDNPELTIRRRSRAEPTLLNHFEMATEGNGDQPVPDLQAIEELCQPYLNGPGDPIAPIAIQATNFGLKNDMIQQSIKVNGVTNDALRLYLFPYSLTHHSTAWFDRLPRNSINTFEQMAKIFLGKYFPPSMVTKLRNKITNFRQRPDELLFEAWEHYKLSIDRCPNHNMLPVTQIDTFYNGLTLRYRDTINAAAGETFMKRRPEECYDLIENMTAHHNDWYTSAQQSESSTSITSSSNTEIAALKAKMAEINKNLIRVLQVKAVTPLCETYGGPHSFNDCPAIVSQTQNVYAMGAYQGRNQIFQRDSHGQNPPPAYQAPVYQAPVHQPQIPQPQVVTTNEFTNFMKANDAILKNMQTNMTSLTNSNLELKNMFGQFMKMNTASSLGSRTLPSNTITNPKEELKGITTRSGTAYQGPTIPTTFCSLPPVVERETEATKDMVHPTNNGSTKDVQPPIVQTESIILNSEPVVAPIIEPVVAPVSAPMPNQRLSISFVDALILMPKFGPTIKTLLTNKDKMSELTRTLLNEHCSVVLLKKLPEKLGDPGKFLIPYFDVVPQVPLILGRSFLKIGRAFIDVFEGELTLRVGKEDITFNLDQTLRNSANYNDMTANRIDVIDMACEEYSQEVLGFFDVIASGNPTPYYDLIVSTTSHTLTLFRNSDFLLEEVDAFLALEDDPTSPEVDQSYELKIYEAKTNDSSIDEPPKVELKDLPPHLEYVFLEADDKFPVIIAKDLSVEEKTALITLLKSHKRAIA